VPTGGGAAALTASTSGRRNTSAAVSARAAIDTLSPVSHRRSTCSRHCRHRATRLNSSCQIHCCRGASLNTTGGTPTPERGSRTPAAKTTAFSFPPSTVIALERPIRYRPPKVCDARWSRNANGSTVKRASWPLELNLDIAAHRSVDRSDRRSSLRVS
jgi:hypothetical protein